jgi:hypothetical protein
MNDNDNIKYNKAMTVVKLTTAKEISNYDYKCRKRGMKNKKKSGGKGRSTK